MASLPSQTDALLVSVCYTCLVSALANGILIFYVHVPSPAAPVEPASCNNCAESGNTAGDRWTAASPGTFGEAFTTTCGTTPDAKLPPCSKFYFTGQKRARDCGGTMRCYAEAQLTPGGPKYWMFRWVGQGLAQLQYCCASTRCECLFVAALH